MSDMEPEKPDYSRDARLMYEFWVRRIAEMHAAEKAERKRKSTPEGDK